ncbi:hypothetical protein [Thermodesulfobacterium commune]|uniref:Conjugal transfer protein TraB n=2 Tax=Thermodesulfobacterium commune TaxID=1741 RepID=A0A075WT70_9BACT|nr:hypothetical protein [Thermodesulfobacterium commune]AIH04494.1 hypothetical protein HL41_07225 [Thermodesulfobacterium commune DSM 2178]HAA84569.1 hypothetical protein [Thermodesulfobacterium commune]HBT04458.1 hypothetical protein [Thermodesulfobacterium commune]HCE79286.1 hypothetical protein [Thermodesulfobacterium commune]HCP09785.1 hypothetical protein [Thermodesulfobacterium commune]
MSTGKIVNLENKNKTAEDFKLSPLEEITLKTTKEIVIKFIEMGRCSPATFEEVFTQVFSVIKKTLTK